MLKVDTIMAFGKYKGIEIGDIIMTNPSYIRWMLDTFEKIQLDDEAYELFETYMYSEDEEIYL